VLLLPPFRSSFPTLFLQFSCIAFLFHSHNLYFILLCYLFFLCFTFVFFFRHSFFFFSHFSLLYSSLVFRFLLCCLLLFPVFVPPFCSLFIFSSFISLYLHVCPISPSPLPSNIIFLFFAFFSLLYGTPWFTSGRCQHPLDYGAWRAGMIKWLMHETLDMIRKVPLLT
jgi:hypothetical protein